MNVRHSLQAVTISFALLVGLMPSALAAQKPTRKAVHHVRYVRIELPGNNRIISLAEVQVMRNERNIASHGIASQSTTGDGGLAGRAIDGNTSGLYAEGSVTHTTGSSSPWWELDLGNPQSVERINIFNRTDCCGERLNKFTIKLLDRRREVLWERNGLAAPAPRTDYLMSGEAVVLGAGIEDAAMPDDRRRAVQPAINAAIQQGVAFLKDSQLRDGSWGEHTPKYRSGQTALSVYTLVKAGVPRTDPAVRMGLAFLRNHPPEMTYSIGVTMMLYETLADKDLRRAMRSLLGRLIETQHQAGVEQGLWGYPSGYDLSATQYAALGLLAAQRAGMKVPREVYRGLLEGTLRNQGEPLTVQVQSKEGVSSSSAERKMAGFSYKTGDGTYTGSMTTAGIAILEICRRGLDAKETSKDMVSANAGTRMGLEWLHRNFSVTTNPVKGKHHHYYLYGVERVGALLSMDYIGGKEWYWEGAEVLVKSQGAEGAWAGQSDTCFALLFLSRASRYGGAASGPTLAAREDVRVSEGPAVDIEWRAVGVAPVTMWISGFNQMLIDDYSEEGGLVEGLRISRVDYLCDGEVIESIPVDVTRGWNGERFPVQHHFEESGTHRMEVLVRLVDPQATEGEVGEAEIVSKPLEVYVRDQFDVATIEAAAKKTPSLLVGPGMTAEASSQAGNHNDVLKAIDGSQGTNWLCAKGEEVPTLTFKFEKPVRANQLVLSDANSSILNSETYDRPTRIEVNINNRPKPKAIDVSGGVLSSWILDFKATRVSSIQIRILEREPGRTQRGLVGFSEVELLFYR